MHQTACVKDLYTTYKNNKEITKYQLKRNKIALTKKQILIIILTFKKE